jgi:hypothetical protein
LSGLRRPSLALWAQKQNHQFRFAALVATFTWPLPGLGAKRSLLFRRFFQSDQLSEVQAIDDMRR